MSFHDVIHQRWLQRALLVAGASSALYGISASSALAGVGSVDCNGGDVWVAPGGEVQIPTQCSPATGFPAPNFALRRDASAIPAVSAGELTDQDRAITAPTKGISERLTFRAAGTLSTKQTVTFRGVMVNTGTSADVSTTSSSPTDINISVDTSGAKAPYCEDVQATVTAGATVNIPLSCVGPDTKLNPGKQLVFEQVGNPTKGSVNSVDQTNGAISYTAHAGVSDQEQLTYRAKTKDGEQTTNTAKITVAITQTPKPPEKTNHAPTCKDDTKRFVIPSKEEIKELRGKKIHEIIPDLEKPNPIQLHCEDADGDPVRVEIVQPMKFGRISDFQPETGNAVWRPFTWKNYKDGDPTPPTKNFPGEFDPGLEFPKAPGYKDFSWGYDESLTFQAKDSHGAVSAPAKLTVRSRDLPSCTGYLAGEVNVGNGRSYPITQNVCEVEVPGLNDGSRKIPFSDQPSLPVCKNLTVGPSVSWQTSRWIKATNETKIRLRVTKTVSRGGELVIELTGKGKSQVFPPLERKEKNDETVSVDGKAMEISLDDYYIGAGGRSKSDEKYANSVPQNLRIDGRTLKSGRHTITIVVNEFSKKDATTKKLVSLNFNVTDCGGARLEAEQRKRGKVKTILRATSGGPELREARFVLPKRSARPLNIVIGRLKTLSLKKRKSGVLAQRGSIVVSRKGNTITVTGLPKGTSNVLLGLPRKTKGKFKARLTGEQNSVDLKTKK